MKGNDCSKFVLEAEAGCEPSVPNERMSGTQRDGPDRKDRWADACPSPAFRFLSPRDGLPRSPFPPRPDVVATSPSIGQKRCFVTSAGFQSPAEREKFPGSHSPPSAIFAAPGNPSAAVTGTVWQALRLFGG